MKYRVAIGTNDKQNVTEHFGGSRQFTVVEIDQEKDSILQIGDRICPFASQCGGHQEELIREKIQMISDCQIVLVNKIGGQSEKRLNQQNMIALQYQGSIESALSQIMKFYKKYIFVERSQFHD